MTAPLTSRRHDALALLILAALAVGVLWRCNLAGRAMLPGDLLLIMEPGRHYSRQFSEFRQVGNPILDAVQQFYPWRQFAGQSLRRGEVPLWNPHELSGNPFLANDQSALFYPETWLHALLPTERALGWATSLYFFLSGALMYGFLRALGLRWAACLLGALAFMFNGFVVGWQCFPSFRSVPGWLPGMLWAVEGLRRNRLPGPIALGALCCGMQFLAGNLHISLYVLMVFAAFALFRALGQQPGRRMRLLIGAATVVALGTALAAVQLLPTLEFVTLSSRAAGTSYADVLRNALALPALLTALMPDILGNPVDYNHWGADLGRVYRAYTESAFYVGLLPVFLAPAAFRAHRSLARFFLGVALVGAALAVGTHLNAVLYYLVPVFKSLSGIGRAVVMICAAMPVLGALGLDALMRQAAAEPAGVRRYALVTGTTLGLVGLLSGMWVWMFTGGLERALPGIGAYTLTQIGRFAILLVLAAVATALLTNRPRLGAALALAALSADLYLFVDHFTPAVKPAYLHVKAAAVSRMQSEPGPWRMLSLGPDAVRRMAPNTPMLWGLEDVQGSDSLEVGAYRKLLNAASRELGGFPQPDPSLPLMDLLGVRWVHSGAPLPAIEGLELVSETDGCLYRNTHALPRAFLARRVTTMPLEQAFLRMVAPDMDPGECLLTSAGTSSAGPLTPLRVTPQGPNRVRVEGELPAGRTVVLTSTFFPGWRCYADGVPLPVQRADYALRAVQLTVPARALQFLFVPASLQVGAFISLLAVALIAGCVTAARGAREVQP